MMRAIARYGVRSVPGDEKEIIAAFRRGEAVEGPAIAEYESRFAEYHGMQHAISASFGRMACYYILRALDLPPGSEIIFPALAAALPIVGRDNYLNDLLRRYADAALADRPKERAS